MLCQGKDDLKSIRTLPLLEDSSGKHICFFIIHSMRSADARGIHKGILQCKQKTLIGHVSEIANVVSMPAYLGAI